MLPLYLFALIVGGGLLLFSLFAGDDGDAHAAEAEANVGHASDLHHDVANHAWVEAQDFLSIRSMLYLLAGFGASGTLLDLLTPASTLVALAWAVFTGIAAAALAASVYGWVRNSGSGEVPTDPDYLRGVAARVIVPVHPGHRGKILALHGGREVELLARLFRPDDAPCLRGSEVVIVDIEGDTALVTPLSVLPSDTSSE